MLLWAKLIFLFKLTVARFLRKSCVRLNVQYLDMEQLLSLQQTRPSLSSGQADSDWTQYNARVTKHQAN